MDCVHLTPPDPTKWEYTGFVVVVVVVPSSEGGDIE